MDMDKNKTREKRIKNYILIFILCLLLVTFFSKSIHNLTLPKVIYKKPSSGFVNLNFSFEDSVISENIISRYAGVATKVVSVLYKDGEKVLKGDIVMLLDDSTFKNEKENLEYKLSKNNKNRLRAKKELLELLNKSSFKYSEILGEVRKEYETNQKLFDSGILSKYKFEKSEINFKSAEGVYNSLVFQKEEEVDDLNYKIKELNYLLEECNKIISNCVVTADFEGILSNVSFRNGMTTNSNSLLFDLQILGKEFYVKHLLDKEKVKFLKIGDKVDIYVIGKAINTTGSITSINKSSSLNYKEVSIVFKDNDTYFGDEVKVTLNKKIASYDYVLPLEAIYSEYDKSYIYVLVEEDGPLGKEYYCIKKYVELGVKNNRIVGIETSLDRYNKIVIRSSKPLIGDPVEVYIER